MALPEHNPEIGSEQVLILAETDLPEEEHRALRRRVRQAVPDALGLTAVRVDFVPSQWLIKTTWEVVLTPVTYAVVGFLKRREGVEVFDSDTDFNPFGRGAVEDIEK